MLIWILAYFVMSEGLFTAQIVVCLIWLFIALCIANFYPLIDGGAKLIWMVLTNQKANIEVKDGQDSPLSARSSTQEQSTVLRQEKGRTV